MRRAWYTPAVLRPRAIAVTGLLLLGLSASADAWAGEPVLLPDFTPGTVSEFGLASILQQTTETALSRAGHVVLKTRAVENVVGRESLAACFDEPTCPHRALGKLPARFGVVVRVRRDGTKVFADVRLYEQTGRDPLAAETYEVTPGSEDELGRKVADLIDEMAKVMGPADARDLIDAAKLITAWEEGLGQDPDDGGSDPVDKPDPDVVDKPDPVPDPVDKPDPQVVDTPEPPPEGVLPPHKPPEPIDLSTPEGVAASLADTPYELRHLVGVKQNYIDSGMDVRTWAARRTPHAGRAIIEVRGGLSIGDVDRLAQVRTTVTADGQEKWFREGPLPAQRVRGDLFAGYAPTAWMDVGVMIGLQYGERQLDSGWTDDAGGGETSNDSVQAVQFALQPRLRFYPVRMGPVKPYLAAGWDLRFFDRWRIRPVEGVEYGEPPGGMVPGPVIAGGLLIDPSPIVGLFAEGSYSHTLGQRAVAAQVSGILPPATAPTIVEGDRRVIAIVGGVQFRL